MKHFNLKTKSVKSLFLLLAMLLGGTSPTWAQKALPYSYGFEDYDLATDGWTTVNKKIYTTISTEAKKSGSYGFLFYYDTSKDQYLVSPELTGATSNGISVSFAYRNYSSSYPEKFQVGYSTTTNDPTSEAFTWDEVVTLPGDTQWYTYNNSFTAAVKYIAIKYIHQNTYKLYIDDISINKNIVGPGLAVADGTTNLTTGHSYNFGLATSSDTKTFTLRNSGTESITLNIAATNGFGVSPANVTIAAKGEETLTVTMADATATGAVTITPVENVDPFTINVSGTIRDPNKVYLDFADGQMPDGWTSEGTSGYYSYDWVVSTGYISYQGSGSSNAGKFVSPKLNFEKDELIAFETAKYGNDSYSPSITVEYSLDGTTWTAIGSAFTDDVYGTWTKRNVTIPVEGVKYIRFNGWYIHMRNIYGGQEIARPKNVTATNIASTSATIGWTAFGNETAWQVSYSTTSGAPTDGTLVSADATTKVISGLTAETTYYVSVRIDNGGGSYGEWTDEISFTTKPTPISTYPYTENFNSLSSGEIPAFWDNSEGTTTNESYKWVHYSTGHEGKCVRFDSYNNNSGMTNFLKTRPFSFTEGQLMKLTFWYKNPAGGDFSVYASTDGGSTYPTELATGLTGKSDWTEKEIEIPATIFGNNVVIVFKGTSNWASGDAFIYLDDITISEVSDYSMAISGSDVSENTIAFGTVKNTTTTKTFTITNDGGSNLTNISVVSSDAEVFTVSDTGFDLAAGATKDITVTFVKAVEGDYSKTITISQANISTPIELTVTATYATPTPATMAVTLDNAAVGETVAFGTVNKATTKTFKVTNTGEATLNATIALSGADAAKFALSTTSLEVAGESEETFTVTFDSDEEDVAKTAKVTLSAEGLSNIAFNVTGTYVNMWSEDFEGGAIPAGWDNSGFEVKTGTVGSYPQYTLTSYVAVGNGGSTEKTLITPLLTATAGDKLTFDGFFYYGDETFKVDYSTDLSTWNNLYTYDKSSYSSGTTNNIEIESAITGEFYLRFTVNYYNGIDNIVGFKLAPAKEHDAVIASKTIPATGNQYVEYSASVTVKEKAGKDDEVVTAELWIGTTKVATESNVTLTANGDKVIELTFTPDAAMSGDAYIKVYNDDIDLTSETQAVTIAAATVLDEETAPTLAEGTLPSVVVKYTAKNGWNTICMPFALTSDILTSIFGTGWKAYEFKSYNGTELGFSTATTFYAGYPYIVYVETAATHTDGVQLQNVAIARTAAQYDQYGGAYFRGTYAPVAAGAWTKNADTDIIYGVTSDGYIKKAGSNASIKGFRAYFDLPAGAAAPSISFDDTTTGIKSLTPALSEGEEAVYNLNGQKVQKAQKGLYIVNGRKVVIK